MSDALSALPDPHGLLFDLDGTLVDTVETRIAAWLRTFDEIGIPADRDHVARLIGADGKRLAMEVAGVAGREITRERAEAIDRHAGEVFAELNSDPQPIAGARHLLIALGRSRLRWTIATSSRSEQTTRSVDALELPEPPMIVDGSHVEHAKPAPDLLLLGAERLGSQPHACWCIGDATWDMAAAIAAPMVAIGCASGAASEQDLLDAGANAVTTLEGIESELRLRGLLD